MVGVVVSTPPLDCDIFAVNKLALTPVPPPERVNVVADEASVIVGATERMVANVVVALSTAKLELVILLDVILKFTCPAAIVLLNKKDMHVQ